MRHPRSRDIDPQVMAGVPSLSVLDAADPSSMTVEGIPAFRARVAAWLASEPPPAEVPEVSADIATLTLADGYPLRLAVYRPTRLRGQLAGLFHIHGGGMISGSIDTERAAMASLAAATDSVVLPRVFHGWEGAAPDAAVTRQATAARLDALRRALHGHPPPLSAPGRAATGG